MPDKARGYLLSPLAEQDLEDIWRYTARTWSRDQADGYHGGLMAAIEGLVSGENIGRDAEDIRGAYRRYAVGRHVLFYREEEATLIIVRILHQSMDVHVHLGPRQ